MSKYKLVLILKEFTLRFSNFNFLCEQTKDLLSNVFQKSELLISFTEDINNIVKVLIQKFIYLFKILF